ncbi:MAG: AraC family transcriptional regulator, partial [Cyanobacteria bacterium J06649_4]
PSQLGSGYTLSIKLRGGLHITIICGQLQQPLIMPIWHPKTFPLVAKFYLSGASRMRAQNVSRSLTDYEECGGHSYLYWLPDMAEVEEWRPHEYTQVVTISADLDYFQAFDSTGIGLPKSLQHLLQKGRFHQPLGSMTLAMNQVLRQILHCPYQGMTQQLYLECKALELLALQFDCLETDAVGRRQLPAREAAPSRLKAKDLEQVQYARELLMQQLENPPSVVDLSHQVGLSDRKLKQGFRELFGTTVFGYLRDCRMEQAQSLLRQSHITVAKVAAQVGYRNPEAFSTAFRRKFSVSPKAYQMAQRR